MSIRYELLKNTYQFSSIPCFYFEKGSLVSYYPSNAGSFQPPLKYFRILNEQELGISFLVSEAYCFYGVIREHGSENFCIIGPISSVPYNKNIISMLQKDYVISGDDLSDFTSFLYAIPQYHLNQIQAYLKTIYYLLNKKIAKPEDIMGNARMLDKNFYASYVNQQYKDKENEFINNSLDIERRFLTCIEKGDIEGLNRFFKDIYTMNIGTLANNNLRQVKNYTIVSISLCCRASIQGGLLSDTAFHLSDSYIQQLEASDNIELIQNLTAKMMLDFTTRVAEDKISISKNHEIQHVLEYVHRNINRHLTVSDIAKHVGFSRAYLSHKFKETLGFDLSSFIYRCKLEEAKELLRYTDKSIGEISNYLYFSNQSHFQNCFKKQFGITPRKYRNGVE